MVIMKSWLCANTDEIFCNIKFFAEHQELYKVGNLHISQGGKIKWTKLNYIKMKKAYLREWRILISIL